MATTNQKYSTTVRSNMKAMFLTEREALKFITDEFGDNVQKERSSVDCATNFDIDKMPFSWDGETAAWYLPDQNVVVGYWEPEWVEFKVSFCGVEVECDSNWGAQQVIEKMKSLAEDLNVAGMMTLRTNSGLPELEEINIELQDEDEEPGSEADFRKGWDRLILGESIKAERIRQGLSIRELAARADLSKNNVDRVESGVYGYNVDTLHALASALGLDIKIC